MELLKKKENQTKAKELHYVGRDHAALISPKDELEWYIQVRNIKDKNEAVSTETADSHANAVKRAWEILDKLS